jgi:flagellin
MSSLNIKGGLSPLGTFQQQQQRKRDQNRHARRLQVDTAGSNQGGPVSLVIPPRLQAQVAGLTRIIVDGEAGVSLIQTAEAALHELLKLLEQLQKLASYASTGIENNLVLRNADQRELENLILNIDDIAEVTSYGPEKLLDGSHEVHGVAQGEYLEFVSATAETKTAPVSGYDVLITKAPAPSALLGLQPLTRELLNAGEQLWFREKQKQHRFRAQQNEDHQQFLKRLNYELQGIGLPLSVRLRTDQLLQVEHQCWGSEPTFEVASSTPGILGSKHGTIRKANPGIDVAGQIDGVEAIGKGPFLYVPTGSGRVSGICLRINGQTPHVQVPLYGSVSLFQNALRFGSHTAPLRLNMRSVCSADLGRHVPNHSGFENLGDLNITTAKGGKDALLLIEQATQEIRIQLDEVGIFRTGRLQGQLVQLREKHTKLVPVDEQMSNKDQAYATAVATSKLMQEDQMSGIQAQASHSPTSLQSLLD